MGITLLAEALRKAGHKVFVIAPASNRSGVSHAISFFINPCKIVEIGEDTWSCEGTPVDCVVLGLKGGFCGPVYSPGQECPVDMILSGINKGANLGTDIVYSGTAAAARQGSLVNIPSVALSLVENGGEWHWETAVEFVVERLDEMAASWKPDSFVNVNMPNRPELPGALVHAFPSFRYYNDSIETYRAPDNCLYCFARAGDICTEPEHGSDREAVMGNNASLSEVYIHPVLREFVLQKGEA